MNITTKGISKTIKKKQILDNVTLTMSTGNIYGFVGANGSGKTMFFRILAGLVKPSSGEMMIEDESVHSIKDISIGLVLENIGLYPEMSGFQNLKYLSGIRKEVGDNEIKNAIAGVGLDPENPLKVGKYSLGMKQKIVLAQAFMEKSQLLLLDEPTNGLDEESATKIRKMIKEQADLGAIVAIASHNKEDIEQLCDVCYKVVAGKITKM